MRRKKYVERYVEIYEEKEICGESLIGEMFKIV